MQAVPSTRRLPATVLRFSHMPSIRQHLPMAAAILWSVVVAPIAVHVATAGGRWWALLALVAGPAAYVLRRRPVLAGATLVAGATILRVAFLGWSFSDPIETAYHASLRAFAGLDPYGGYIYTDGRAGAAYPYGPLGLVTYRLGIPGEMVAVIGTSAVLIWARAWLTLAFFNAWPQFLLSPAIGNNDYSVGLVLLASLVLLRRHPRVGVALLAAASAIKPYAAAWLLPAFGFVGLPTAAFGLGGLLVAWYPVLFIWGMPSFLASLSWMEAGRATQAAMEHSSWAFADLPVVRLLAGPLALAGLLFRSWRATVLLGTAAFVVFLGFAPSAHAGYIAVIVPIVGIALEGRFWSGSRDPQPGGM